MARHGQGRPGTAREGQGRPGKARGGQGRPGEAREGRDTNFRGVLPPVPTRFARQREAWSHTPNRRSADKRLSVVYVLRTCWFCIDTGRDLSSHLVVFGGFGDARRSCTEVFLLAPRMPKARILWCVLGSGMPKCHILWRVLARGCEKLVFCHVVWVQGCEKLVFCHVFCNPGCQKLVLSRAFWVRGCQKVAFSCVFWYRRCSSIFSDLHFGRL